MSLRNLSWQQVVVLVACLAATIAAYKFLGPEAGSISAVVSTVLSFLLGRDPPAPPSPPDGAPTLKLVTGGAAAAALIAAIVTQGGCGASLTPGGAYAAEQTACASTSRTFEESRACRRAVDRRWGIGDASTEAGDK